MISVSIQNKFDGVLAMDVLHEECIDIVKLPELFERIEDIYRYISERSDTVIRFTIENALIELTLEGLYINVFYRSQHVMFDRNCSKCEIKILDDDSINMRCYNGDKLVFLTKIM